MDGYTVGAGVGAGVGDVPLRIEVFYSRDDRTKRSDHTVANPVLRRRGPVSRIGTMGGEPS